MRWASYTPSESVSTRWIVAPGYFASAAALTFSAVSPVSRVSSGRWLLVSSRVPGAWSLPAGPGADDEAVGVGSAALAIAPEASNAATDRPPRASTAPAAYRRQLARISIFMRISLTSLPCRAVKDHRHGLGCASAVADLGRSCASGAGPLVPALWCRPSGVGPTHEKTAGAHGGRRRPHPP